MKKLLLFIVFFLVLVGLSWTGYAQDKPDLSNEINQTSLQIIQLQAQDNFMVSQYSDQAEVYVAKRNEIKGKIDQLRKKLSGLQKQQKAESKPIPPAEKKE